MKETVLSVVNLDISSPTAEPIQAVSFDLALNSHLGVSIPSCQDALDTLYVRLQTGELPPDAEINLATNRQFNIMFLNWLDELVNSYYSFEYILNHCLTKTHHPHAQQLLTMLKASAWAPYLSIQLSNLTPTMLVGVKFIVSLALHPLVICLSPMEIKVLKDNELCWPIVQSCLELQTSLLILSNQTTDLKLDHYHELVINPIVSKSAAPRPTPTSNPTTDPELPIIPPVETGELNFTSQITTPDISSSKTPTVPLEAATQPLVDATEELVEPSDLYIKEESTKPMDEIAEEFNEPSDLYIKEESTSTTNFEAVTQPIEETNEPSDLYIKEATKPVVPDSSPVVDLSPEEEQIYAMYQELKNHVHSDSFKSSSPELQEKIITLYEQYQQQVKNIDPEFINADLEVSQQTNSWLQAKSELTKMLFSESLAAEEANPTHATSSFEPVDISEPEEVDEPSDDLVDEPTNPTVSIPEQTPTSTSTPNYTQLKSTEWVPPEAIDKIKKPKPHNLKELFRHKKK